MKKTSRKQLRTLRRRRLALALVGAMAMPMAALAQTSCTDCLPYYGQVVSGSVSSNYSSGGVIRPNSDANDSTMTVTQTTHGAIIDWGSFNIGTGYEVRFVVPDSSAVTLNRVVSLLGPGYAISSSLIDGAMASNGNVFIINPAGITFGGGAQVNVGGLLASTLWMNSGDFINGLSTGQYVFNGFNGDTSASHEVTNSGSITAGAGGVGLFGPEVRNNGNIVAVGGNVGLGAGTAVTLDFFGDGLTQITMNGAAGPTEINSASNYGDITADGGQIFMRALTYGLNGGVVNGGNLRARTISNRAGRIELTSSGGSVILGDLRKGYLGPGTIDVTGGAGMQGGSVFLQAGFVYLMSEPPGPGFDPPSWIDASGGAGGGSVVINSIVTRLYEGTSIRADSLGAGNGGTVQISGLGVIADQNTLISASSANGNGGLIDLEGAALISAYGRLQARGTTAGGNISTTTGGEFDIRGLQVDAGADGTAGTWTLTAPNLDVINGADTGTVFETRISGTAIQDEEINAALANGSNVTLNAGTNPDDAGNVYFAAGVDIFYDDGTAPLTFQLNANGFIVGDDFSIGSNDAALSMHFNANADGTGLGGIGFSGATLESSGGDIAFYGESDAVDGTASGFASGIVLRDTTITTDGGSLLLRGSSADLRGGDTSDDAGVALISVDIDTGTGAIDIYGLGVGATGGVVVQNSQIDGGSVAIHGIAEGAGDGVNLYYLDIDAGSGDVIIDGRSVGGDGLYAYASNIFTSGGDIALTGIGGTRGVFFDGDSNQMYSDGGDIVVHGEGGSGVGTYVSALVDSGGGDIDMYGSSTASVGLDFGGGYYSGMISGGGDIVLTGIGATQGVRLQPGAFGGASAIDSAGGAITVTGSASAADGIGVYSNGVDLIGGAGDVTVTGTAPLGIGIIFAGGAGVSTTTGAIGLYGTGADFGLDIADGALDTDSGDITLDGTATAADAVAGVRVTGDGLVTNGGDITVTGTSAGGVGVQLGDGSAFAIGSGGGAIVIEGTGIDAGVLMQGNQVASGGGAVSITGSGVDVGVSLDGSDIDSAGGDIDVDGTASGAGGVGVDLAGARLSAGSGHVNVFGSAVTGTGVRFDSASGIATTTGDISLTGIGEDVGLAIDGGEFTTDSGHIDLRGRATGAASAGLVIGNGVSVATAGGGIELSGEGRSGAGISIGTGSLVDAGDSLIVLRAANDGSSDAIRLQGAIRSGVGVNLRPGGVDANGGLVDHVDDDILIGSGNGFALDAGELARIDTPELIIGSNLHAGAIQVLAGVNRDGNLTLQNDGGSGGIDIQAGLDVGDGTLALSSGGSITQTSAGVITAHSLLAQAAGDVLLATALNDVANTTLAGSAGGDFEFQDANTLAIGSVSAIGFDASAGQLSSFAATGISAGGDAFVRNLQGDLTLNAGVTATNIDLVTAGRLQNVAGASLVASGDWRVWANTWVGETRGGLAGDGNLPNLYGCAYLGACGVTVPGADNHFIYVQQPIALISFNNATREYGLPNPLLTFSVTGAILGDTAANVAAGSATTTATIGSDVGNYAITGNFLSAAGYRIQFVPGTLAITPATLLFTADGAIRYLGFPNPDFTGTVTGFRNGDTVASVFGNTVIWSSPAGPLAPIGFYPVVGGTSARNYVFAQAEGNARALQIIPLPQLPSTPIEFIRETVNTYVYDRNFGGAPVCAVNASIDDTGLASTGDGLSTEWTKVRSRPNLTNCFDSERENGCGDF